MRKTKLLCALTALVMLLGCFSFAAAAQDEDYCLNADFTSLKAGDTLPAALTVLTGKAGAQNGYVQLEQSSIVSINLPDGEKLADFTMEVDFTIASANEDTRWISFMYRMAGAGADPKPYMQMCIRRGAAAANGVEIACKDNGGSWQYNGKGAFSERISPDKIYTAKIVCRGSKITQSINGQELLYTDSALLTDAGGFALQTNAAVLRVYAVRISKTAEIADRQEPASDTVRMVYEPETGIIAPPSVVEYISSKEGIASLSKDAPTQAAWFALSKLEGVSLSDIFAACRLRIIPVLELDSTQQAQELQEYIKQSGETDFIVVSASAEVLGEISAKGVRKGLITDKTGAEGAFAVHSANADIAVVPALTREQAEYFQARFLSVMLRPENTSDDSAVRAALDCGANHVVVSDHAKAYELFSSVDQGEAFVRRPFIVAHRGVPSLAPENTVEGMREAASAGADAVECDVYVTSDGHLLINHNGTTGGYTTSNDNVNVERLTREQLKEYTLRTVGKYNGAHFAFLDELFDEMKNNDLMLVIEIKSKKAKCARLISELAREKGMLDRIAIISFYPNQIKKSREEMPEVGASLLVNAQGDGAVKSMETFYIQTASAGGSYSPSSALTAAATRALAHRGALVNMWTVDGGKAMLETARKGVSFITTNTAPNRKTVDDAVGQPDAASVLAKSSDPVTPPPAQQPTAEPGEQVQVPFGLHWVLIPIAVVVIGASVLIAVFFRKRRK